MTERNEEEEKRILAMVNAEYAQEEIDFARWLSEEGDRLAAESFPELSVKQRCALLRRGWMARAARSVVLEILDALGSDEDDGPVRPG